MKSKLVKGLPQKRGTSPPEVNPTGLAAGLLHGRDATVALHFEGTVVALAMRPQGHDQTRLCVAEILRSPEISNLRSRAFTSPRPVTPCYNHQFMPELVLSILCAMRVFF